MTDIGTLLAELERLYHRQADLRARERQLADDGRNDPASDTWKTAAIVAASAEADFQAALVRNWPALAAFLREAAEDRQPDAWIVAKALSELRKHHDASTSVVSGLHRPRWPKEYVPLYAGRPLPAPPSETGNG